MPRTRSRLRSRKGRILAILDGRDPKLGRSVAFAMHGLIFLAATAYAVSTVPDLPAWVYRTLRVLDYAIALVFAAEYALRLWAARNRRRYAFSFWGLVDLFAWAPVLVTASGASASVRVLRLLQLFRLLKILRYSRALNRLILAFRRSRDELVIFLVVAVFLLYLSAVGIYHFEHPVQPEAFSSVPAAFWWAVITLTTVGYGDVVPVTAMGRVFTVVVILLGMGVFAVPAGVIASALISREVEAELDTLEAELEEIREEIEEEGARSAGAEAKLGMRAEEKDG